MCTLVDPDLPPCAWYELVLRLPDSSATRVIATLRTPGTAASAACSSWYSVALRSGVVAVQRRVDAEHQQVLRVEADVDVPQVC